MKQHATIADIFTAGTQAASPFLQERTAELKERNDLELKVFSETYAAELEIEKNSFPYSGDHDGYLRMLNNFNDKKFAEARARQASPYSQQQLEKMQRLSRAMIENHAAGQRAEWQYKNRDAEHANALNKIMASQALDMPKKLQALLDEHELHAGQQGWDPAKRAQKKSELYQALAKGEAVIDIGGKTVRQAWEELKEKWGALSEAIDGREGAAGSFDGWVADNREMLATAQAAAQKAIWKRNFDALAARDREYSRMLHDAETLGDMQAWNAAENMRRLGARDRDAAAGSPEYDPADMARIASMFPANAISEGRGSGSGGGGSDRVSNDTVKASIKTLMDELFAGRLPGQTVYSLQNGDGGRVSALVQYLFDEAVSEGGYGRDIDAFQYEFSPALREYFAIASARYADDPGRQATVAAVQHWFRNNAPESSWLRRRYPEMFETFAGDLLAFHTDTVFSTDWAAATGETVLDAARGRMAAYRGEALDRLMKDRADYSKPSDLAKALAQRDANTNIKYTTAEGRAVTLPGPHTERLERNLEEVNKQSASWIERAHGLEPGRLQPIEKRTADDIDAETIFQYGTSNTFYRAKGNADGSLTIQKAEGIGGEWGGDRQITNRDARSPGAGMGRRLFGTDELRRLAADHADKTISDREAAGRLISAWGADGNPLPVPGFTETDKTQPFFFEMHQIAAENYLRDNGMERYLQWLRENHSDKLPEEWQ